MLRVCFAEDAPLVLLRFLGEEATVVVKALCVLSSRPIILEGGSTFNMLVEGAAVANATTLDGALLLLGVVHYIFNQRVSRAVRSRMFVFYLSRLIIGLPAESTADAQRNLAELQ